MNRYLHAFSTTADRKSYLRTKYLEPFVSATTTESSGAAHVAHYQNIKEEPGWDGWIWCYYQIDDISEASHIFNSSVVESISKMKVDGIEQPVSSDYQFSTTGEHLVQYLMVGSEVAKAQFNNNLLLRKAFVPDNITYIRDMAFSTCSNLELLILPCGVQGSCINGSALNGTIIIKGRLDGNPNFRTAAKNLIVDTLSGSSFSDGYLRTDYCETLRCKSISVPSSYGGPLYGTGTPKLKFLEISNSCTNKNIYSRLPIFTTDAIIHLGGNNIIVTDPIYVNTNAENVVKVYVGNGESQAADQAVLNLYLADENWANYASKLDLWYNYNGEYKQ